LKLTADDLQQIDEAVSRIRIQGHRYGDGSEKMVDKD
jgi:hypothetical protein